MSANLSNLSAGSLTSSNLSANKVLNRTKSKGFRKIAIERFKSSQLNNRNLTARNAELLLLNRESEMMIENLNSNNFNLMMRVAELQNEKKKINSEYTKLKELCLKQENVLECIKNAFPSNFEELKVPRKSSIESRKTRTKKRSKESTCRRSYKPPGRCLITAIDATKNTDQEPELDERLETSSEDFELDLENVDDLNAAINVEDELENTVISCEKSVVNGICEYSIENATGVYPSHSLASYFENGIQENETSIDEENIVEANMKVNISNSKTKCEESLDASFFSKPKKRHKSIKPTNMDDEKPEENITKENEPLEQLTNKQATTRVTFGLPPVEISEVTPKTISSRNKRKKKSDVDEDVSENNESKRQQVNK